MAQLKALPFKFEHRAFEDLTPSQLNQTAIAPYAMPAWPVETGSSLAKGDQKPKPGPSLQGAAEAQPAC
jgi:hypothetical protein